MEKAYKTLVYATATYLFTTICLYATTSPAIAIWCYNWSELFAILYIASGILSVVETIYLVYSGFKAYRRLGRSSFCHTLIQNIGLFVVFLLSAVLLLFSIYAVEHGLALL